MTDEIEARAVARYPQTVCLPDLYDEERVLTVPLTDDELEKYTKVMAAFWMWYSRLEERAALHVAAEAAKRAMAKVYHRHPDADTAESALAAIRQYNAENPNDQLPVSIGSYSERWTLKVEDAQQNDLYPIHPPAEA